MRIEASRHNPYTVQLTKRLSDGRPEGRGFAFIRQDFKSELDMGNLQENMVQLLLHIECGPQETELPRDLKISMIMRNWVCLRGNSTSVLWDVFEGDPGKGDGVIEISKHWLGLEMRLGDNFVLGFNDPDLGPESYHSFYYVYKDKLRIYPAYTYDIIPKVDERFKNNAVLQNLMQQLSERD